MTFANNYTVSRVLFKTCALFTNIGWYSNSQKESKKLLKETNHQEQTCITTFENETLQFININTINSLS